MNCIYLDDENKQAFEPIDDIYNEDANNANASSKDPFASNETAKPAHDSELGKMYFVLFFLFIPQIVGSTLSSVGSGGMVSTVGDFISIASSVIYILYLIKLGKYVTDYKKAGIFMTLGIVGSLIDIIIAFVGPERDPEALYPLDFVSLPFSLIALYGTFLEFKSHAAITLPVNRDLSEKWNKCLKGYIICLAILLCTVVLIFIPILGWLLLGAAAIGVISFSILKIIYLYKMSELFK